MSKALKLSLLAVAAATLTACGGSTTSYGTSSNTQTATSGNPDNYEPTSADETVWSLLNDGAKQEVTLKVNKYLWAATLDTLSFLPIEEVDSASGVIVTGYGTPPGGGRSYRATIHIKDPALAPRSLNVALMTRNGPASAATTRAVEDAILNRARQLRIADDKL